MLKLMTLVKASPTFDHAGFRDYWAGRYLPSILAAPEARGIVRIVHNHAVPLHIRDDDQISEGGWAGVSETWFQNRTDADAFLASSHVHAAEASHAQMMPEISHLLCSELPTWDHGLERASVKMIAFFLPSATMTREQSQHYWTHEHVRVGTTLNDPTPYAPRYVQNHTLPDFHAEKPEYDFAGAPELWFKSEEAARRMFFEAKNLDLLAEDEAKFSDRSTTVMLVTDEQEVYVKEQSASATPAEIERLA